MTSLLVLTPFTSSRAVELGNRAWRKKILPVGDVEYKGRTLHFTRDYLGRLVQAFKDRAYDQVPFQLADHANTHTNDPERTRGEITAMELGDDGLYVTAVVTPDGEKVLKANPKLGVSARIVEGYSRSDGLHFPQAIQHVLGTLDPRIPGLGAWQAIEAASPETDVLIDLSNTAFTKPPKAKKGAKGEKPADHADQAGDGTNPEGTDGMPGLGNLTPEQQAKLTALLALPDDTISALAAGGTVLTAEEIAALGAGTAGDGGDEDLAAEIGAMSDDELAALEAEFEAQNAAQPAEPEREPAAATAGLTAEAQFQVDMANARADETAQELANVTARFREQDYQAERRRLAGIGVPPLITDMARPLLEGTGHTVDLANGTSVDAGAVMRQVLAEYARMVKLLDLDVELGSPVDEPDGAGRDDETQSRDDLKAQVIAMTGLR